MLTRTLLSLVFICQIGQARALDEQRWSMLDPGAGTGGGICSDSGRTACFIVSCDARGALGFSVKSDKGALDGMRQGVVTVDGTVFNALTFDDGVSAYEPVRHEAMIGSIKRGRQMSFSSSGGTYSLGLSGSSATLDTIIRQCSALAERGGPALAFGGEYRRLENEAAFAYSSAERQEPQWKIGKDTDLYGGDLRTGLDDPLLTGMTVSGCEALCAATASCRAFTHSVEGGVCFLKGSPERSVRYQGATSGTTSGVMVPFEAPPTKGPGLVVDESLRWGKGDAPEDVATTIRAASKPLGESCEAEQATLSALAESMEFDLQSARAAQDEAITLAWRGNTLEDRIPVWLMLSSAAPLRFEGSGIIPLGPDAPNPFGLAQGLGEHRALTALHARGAGGSGAVRFRALRLGNADVKVSLVGYLRACEREVVLSERVLPVETTPAPPGIVLNTETTRSKLTHQIDVVALNRKILLDDRRLLVLSAEDGTEILQRQASNPSLSPGHRFMTVESGGGIDVIDLVDGETVAQMPQGEVRWALGDSFVMTTTAPWGRVSLATTFGNGLSIADQTTGAACCPAGEKTRIGIDLENAAFTIWGEFGHRVGALQNPDYATIDNPPSAYAASQYGSAALYQLMLNSIGPVAPVSLDQVPLVSGGFTSTTLPLQALFRHGPTGPEPDFDKLVNETLDFVGLTPTGVKQEAAPVLVASVGTGGGIFRSASNANDLGRSVRNQLGRIGIELAETVQGETVHVMSDSDYVDDPRDDRVAAAQPALARMRAEAEAAGWRFTWAKSPGVPSHHMDCEQIYTASDFLEDHDRHEALPQDVERVQRIDAPGGPVWIMTSICEGGATGGTLRGHSALTLVDLGRPFPGSTDGAIVARNSHMTANYRPVFFEPEFEIKAIGNLLLTYAPGGDAISLFDRDARDFRFSTLGLPEGDLLREAYLTDDLSHIVQLNEDGGLYFHRVADGALVLTGRIVDDEVVLWTDDFHFDATAEAASLIDLRFPGLDGQFSLDRFDAALRTPDLAEAVLSGAAIPDMNAAIAVPPALEGSLVATEGDMIRVEAAFGPEVRMLTLFQDGVETDRIPLEAGETRYDGTANRLASGRWAALVATDAAGLASLPLLHDLGESPNPAAAKNRLLVVGVDRYRDERLASLNFAKADAVRIYDAFGESDDLPTFDRLDPLVDRRASRDAILASIDDLLDGLGKGDHAVLFFAGHGLQDEEGAFYLGLSSTDLDAIGETALPWAQVAERLAKTQARVTVFLDACHAGAAGTVAFASNDGAAIGLSAVASNISILSASKGREFSQESASLGGGVFTIALEQVLSAERDRHDQNDNGRIEASELYAGVKSLVVSRRNGLQTPWMIRSRMVGDYALF